MNIKNLEVDYDVRNQKPIYIDVKLSTRQVNNIVKNFFNKMEYKEKQDWINKNATVL